MAVQFSDLKKGRKAMVRGGFGGQAPQEVTITGVKKNIKNGIAGIDFVDSRGGCRWTYIDCIDSVIIPPMSYQQQEIERAIESAKNDTGAKIINVQFKHGDASSKWLNISITQAEKIQKILSE